LDIAAQEAMGYDVKTAERVRRILASRGGVVEKRMVGGLSFVVDGNMCCGVTGSALMVRVGADARKRVLAEPHVRPMEFAGRPLAGFLCVDPEGFPTDAALAAWVQRGIDFVATLPAKSPAAGRLDPMRRRRASRS
jgi:TfoX/Sxy family transcriptional regulator of competence genes